MSYLCLFTEAPPGFHGNSNPASTAVAVDMQDPEARPQTGSRTPSEKQTANASKVTSASSLGVESLSNDAMLRHKIKDCPPNIALNSYGGSKPYELILYSVIGTVLQIGVLVASGYLSLAKSAPKLLTQIGISSVGPLAGFCMQVVGTTFLTVSMFQCAMIIDRSTEEQFWVRNVCYAIFHRDGLEKRPLTFSPH